MYLPASQRFSFVASATVIASSHAYACEEKNPQAALVDEGTQLRLDMVDVQITEHRPTPHTIYRCYGPHFDAKAIEIIRLARELCASPANTLPKLWIDEKLRKLPQDAFNSRLQQFCRKVSPGIS